MNRPLLALVLVAAAIAIPGVAWYRVGSSQAEQEARRLRDAPLEEALKSAEQSAARIGRRLQALLQAEAKRPYFQYQSYYYDPQQVPGRGAVSLSPLVSGPFDPLVRAYFQIEPSGRLVLPARPEEWAQADGPRAKLRDELERLVPACQEAARDADAPVQQILELSHAAWWFNRTAAGIDRDPRTAAQALERIEKRNAEPARIGESASEEEEEEDEDILIPTGSWVCRLLGPPGKPCLVALRGVRVPRKVLIQGFQIQLEGLADLLAGAPFPARLSRSPALAMGERASEVPGIPGLSVVADARPVLRRAIRAARKEMARFHRRFGAGLVAAFVAGGCLVALFWKVERLERQRAQFAASAAHELRTPLAGLRMYSEMLAERLGDPERGREYARRVAAEAERLGRVVSNVLGFTRLERGTLPVRMETEDPGSAVREAVEKQRLALEAAGARVELSIPDALPAVRLDRDGVTHILQNLLDNAEKYSRESPDRTIRVAVRPLPDAVTVTVSDRGPGVPASIRRRMFRPFVRGVGPEAPAGLGLGLALAQAFARAQGAELSYADDPAGGAVFTVLFRRKP